MNCNQEQSYTHRGNRVIITEYDMVFDYEILRNFHDTLVLRPSHIPSGMWDNLNSKAEMDSLSKNHFRIYLKKNIKIKRIYFEYSTQSPGKFPA